MNIKQNGEIMSYAVAINSSGQATIPKAVREVLHVVPGENRIIFNVDGDTVTLNREASRAEQFDASLAKIHARLAAAERRNPNITKMKQRYAGMTFDEVRDAYDATPEGQRELEEKYGIKL